ncbi:Zinc finger CCHC domain-containing protein 24 [Chionoecetes opilio]|uniref:Zinc finger CCHC domain-containing protein 24 n=1 Tax=Chionoecetes opilio TaxID=41210 RepID=A0A8J5CGF4_CHIOP|nr:Zinc finger CCHC domain-containing protein 24 [Chionoecetes opilio]
MVREEALTPYQGKYRAFEYFYCEECEKEWASANSWANCYQVCKECDLCVYPYKQHRLKQRKGTKKKKTKSHPAELCQRCIDTGTN